MALEEEKTDQWAPFRPLLGEWEGTGSGLPGEGAEEMDCEFVLQGKFLRIRNHSVYEPQENNPEGEVHEDWSFISYDEGRKAFVLREFFVEGYVTQYVLDEISDDGQSMTFLTESIENLPDGWKGRETFRFLPDDEFQNTFELARPGEDYKVYVETRLRRKA